MDNRTRRDTSWPVVSVAFLGIVVLGFLASRMLTKVDPTLSATNALGQHIGVALAPPAISVLIVGSVGLILKIRGRRYRQPRKHAAILATVCLAFWVLGTISN